MGPFIFGMLGALVIISFGNVLKAVQLLFEGRVPKAVILEWFVNRTPEDMQYIFPVAILLSTLLVFSGLSRTQEITALRAAGISLARTFIPVVIFSLMVTGLVFWFLDRVVPQAMKRSQELWVTQIRTNQHHASFKNDILLRDSSNRLVFVGRFNLHTYEMEFVKIRDYSADGTRFEREFSARRGIYQHGKNWVLQDVSILLRGKQGETLLRKDKMTMPMGEGPDDFAQEERSAQEMNFAALLDQIRKLDERGLANTLPLKVELFLKTSFPFCIPIFAVIGSAMGLGSTRTGGFIGFGVSLIITFFYYVTMSLSASLGKTGVMTPFLAAWMHNILFTGVALFVTLRAQSK